MQSNPINQPIPIATSTISLEELLPPAKYIKNYKKTDGHHEMKILLDLSLNREYYETEEFDRDYQALLWLIQHHNVRVNDIINNKENNTIRIIGVQDNTTAYNLLIRRYHSHIHAEQIFITLNIKQRRQCDGSLEHALGYVKKVITTHIPQRIKSASEYLTDKLRIKKKKPREKKNELSCENTQTRESAACTIQLQAATANDSCPESMNNAHKQLQEYDLSKCAGIMNVVQDYVLAFARGIQVSPF